MVSDDTRLLGWLRKQVNHDLWAFRAAQQPQQAEVCKGILAVIRWAEAWHESQTEHQTAGDYPKRVQAEMDAYVRLVMSGVRRLASGYSSRPGWRKEWELK